MITRHFIVGFSDLQVNQAQVATGSNSPEIVTACRCVNVALFVSDGIRRNVKVSLLAGNERDLHVISFPGDRMKRVSPDERSISFFIMKSSEALKQIGVGSTRVLNNGIVVSRIGLEHLLETGPSGVIHVASTQADMLSGRSDISQTGIFVYDISGTLIRHLEKHRVMLLPRPSHPERFILDVNLYCDSTAQSSEEIPITPPRERDL